MSDSRTDTPAKNHSSARRHEWGRFLERVVPLAASMLLAAATGCTPPGTNLSGVVTLDGRPLEAATLQFYPAGGDGQTSHAFTDNTGKFMAKVSPVPLVVTITKAKPTGEKLQSFPDTPPQDVLAESLPPRYSDRKKTELKVTPVASKTTVADFALTSE